MIDHSGVLPQNNRGIRWFTVKIGVKRVFPIEMIDRHGLEGFIVVSSKDQNCVQNSAACKTRHGLFMRSEAKSNLRVAPMRERHDKIKHTLPTRMGLGRQLGLKCS